jgi:hypothetical protein
MSKSREQFETWAKSKLGYMEDTFRIHKSGEYYFESPSDPWEAWKASRAELEAENQKIRLDLIAAEGQATKLEAENLRLRGFIEAGLSALPDDPNCHISRITFENALQEAEDESV